MKPARSKSDNPVVTPPKRAHKLRSDEIDRLVAAYEAGASAREIGEQFGLNKKTVGRHLRARGIDTTPPGLAPELIPEAVWLYEKQGWSLARIGERLGTTANTVRLRMLEAGVKMRDTQGRER